MSRGARRDSKGSKLWCGWGAMAISSFRRGSTGGGAAGTSPGGGLAGVSGSIVRNGSGGVSPTCSTVCSGEADAPFVFHLRARVRDRAGALRRPRARTGRRLPITWAGTSVPAPWRSAWRRPLPRPLVESACSRLVIDCNRDLAAHDLIVTETHGVAVPGNHDLDTTERAIASTATIARTTRQSTRCSPADPRRRFWSASTASPPSSAADAASSRSECSTTITCPSPDASPTRIATTGLVVRHNEPYSGMDGLIYSARMHGLRHRLRYVELEINNALLRDDAGIVGMGAKITTALQTLLPSDACPRARPRSLADRPRLVVRLSLVRHRALHRTPPARDRLGGPAGELGARAYATMLQQQPGLERPGAAGDGRRRSGDGSRRLPSGPIGSGSSRSSTIPNRSTPGRSRAARSASTTGILPIAEDESRARDHHGPRGGARDRPPRCRTRRTEHGARCRRGGRGDSGRDRRTGRRQPP